MIFMGYSIHDNLDRKGHEMCQQYQKKYQIRQIFWTYFLHSLKGQFRGFHFLVAFLRALKLESSLISFVTKSQNSVLDKTNFLYYCDTSYTEHFILKTFHRKWQELLLKYLLQGSVNFLIWNGSDLSVSKNFLKHDVLLLSTMCRNFSSKWFVLLFIIRLWIIHTKGQKLNYDVKTSSLISGFFSKFM